MTGTKKTTPKEGPYVKTARVKKTPGKTVAVGGTQVIKAKGKKPLAFKKGGLHATTGTPQDEKIPAAKKSKALAGGYGPKARKQALFAKDVLAKGQRTTRGKK